jgi:hypothetical protein
MTELYRSDLGRATSNSKNEHEHGNTAGFLDAFGGSAVVLKPIFQVGKKLYNDKLEVVRILSNTEFVVFHQDL